jgi:pyruvate ferredoxin oxidoreductase beta subunit
VATVIGTEPLDLARKIEKAASLTGPRLIITLAPCPTGWGFDPAMTSQVGSLAIKSGIWPLKEYLDNKVVHTKITKERVPVEEYLKTQSRFEHLFKPVRNDKLINEIQENIDAYWANVTE